MRPCVPEGNAGKGRVAGTLSRIACRDFWRTAWSNRFLRRRSPTLQSSSICIFVCRSLSDIASRSEVVSARGPLAVSMRAGEHARRAADAPAKSRAEGAGGLVAYLFGETVERLAAAAQHVLGRASCANAKDIPSERIRRSRRSGLQRRIVTCRQASQALPRSIRPGHRSAWRAGRTARAGSRIPASRPAGTALRLTPGQRRHSTSMHFEKPFQDHCPGRACRRRILP